ncbi:MAG: TrkH family potassium uptake protein [Clostridia bacterium]
MKNLSYSRIIAIGFFVMILIGTMLLMLPISSQSGSWTGFSEAFFTAVSAQCVTGLVIVNTATHWSLFGQLVILFLIQTGGLGFISISVYLSIMMKRKLSLHQRGLFQESMNTLEMSGITHLTKRIMIGVFSFELMGAILLLPTFLKSFSVPKALYYSVFHSISAFCNAGFSTLDGNLINMHDNIFFCVVIMLLVTIGGLGFIVWDDLYVNKLHFASWRLHTKIVVLMTVAITLSGAVLLFITERGTVLESMTWGEKITASFFGAVTARTAGFNTIDVASLSDGGKLITMVIMFIGGSPGSTAGGIKTTTFLVILVFILSNFKRTQPNIFGRRLEDDSVRKATTVFATNLSLVIIASVVLCSITNINLTDTLFETVSAISTVGMSSAGTENYGRIGAYVIAILMYLGRVGSMTFAVSFFEKKKKVAIGYLPERIAIG